MRHHLSRLLFIVIAALLMTGCIESDQELVPLESAVEAPGLEGTWLSLRNPEDGPLCVARTMEPKEYAVWECGKKDTEKLALRVRSLGEDFYLLRLTEGTEPMATYFLVRFKENQLTAFSLVDDIQLVNEILMAEGFTERDYRFADHALTLLNPNCSRRLALIFILAKNTEGMTPYIYVKQ